MSVLIFRVFFSEALSISPFTSHQPTHVTQVVPLHESREVHAVAVSNYGFRFYLSTSPPSSSSMMAMGPNTGGASSVPYFQPPTGLYLRSVRAPPGVPAFNAVVPTRSDAELMQVQGWGIRIEGEHYRSRANVFRATSHFSQHSSSRLYLILECFMLTCVYILLGGTGTRRKLSPPTTAFLLFILGPRSHRWHL